MTISLLVGVVYIDEVMTPEQEQLLQGAKSNRADASSVEEGDKDEGDEEKDRSL